MYNIICPKCGKIINSWPNSNGVCVSDTPCDKCSGKKSKIGGILSYIIILGILYYFFKFIL